MKIDGPFRQLESQKPTLEHTTMNNNLNCTQPKSQLSSESIKVSIHPSQALIKSPTPGLVATNGDHDDDAFAAILPLLEATEIEVISHDDGFVKCPGRELHTNPSASKDCKVYTNLVNGIWVPCLNCFHQSCSEVIEACNRRLYRAALAGRPRVYQNTQSKTVGGLHIQSHRARPNTPTEQQILEMYPWTYIDIINDERGKVEHPPEYHHIYILSLFHDDEVVWIGRDLFDTGSFNHRWRFRPVRDWYNSLSCPGAFICPSTFYPGVHSRSSENVQARKYLVVESDKLTKDEVGSVFKWLEAQGHVLRAVVDTAGKSLHGWFQYPQDPSCIPSLKRDLAALQCDTSMFGDSQPCRLPGAIRQETGRLQQLIYFPILNTLP